MRPVRRGGIPLHGIAAILMVLQGCREGMPHPARSRDSSAPPAGREAPVIREPTVVAFWLPASDTLGEGGSTAELLEEFRDHTASLVSALEAREIAVLATGADSLIVERKDGPRRVITLVGLDYPFGYVLVEPGYPETILTGISTDEELLDEVEWYFGAAGADEEGVPVPKVAELPSRRGRGVGSGLLLSIELEGHRALERPDIHRRAAVSHP